jgi:hypothetical protein
MAEQLDPLTGLPTNVIKQTSTNPNSTGTVLKGTDPLTGLPAEVITSAKPAIAPKVGLGFGSSISQNLTNVYTDPLSNYKEYDVNTNVFSKNWNEQRAQNQPWYEQVGYGIAKAATTVGTSIVDGTLGTANGLLSLAFDKDHSFADNTIGQSMDAINEQMREWLPNYYTQEEQDSLLGALSNPANFIGDKVLGGAAYTVGALATMYLTGGIGVAGGLARGAGLAARAGRAALGAEAGMSELSATYKVAKALKSGEDISKILTGAANTSRYLKLAQQTDVALTMSLSEAAIEARETKKQFIEEKTAEWEENNYGQQMPDEVKEAIDQSAAAAMNTNFAINLAVLGASNAVMFGKMSYKKFSGQAMDDDIANATYKVTRKPGQKGLEYAEDLSNYKLLRGFEKGNRIFGKAGQGMLTESFQEGAQFASNEALQDYYGKKMSGSIEGGFSDIIRSTSKGISETFSTTAGLESMLIGAIVGGGASVLTGTGNKQKTKNTKEFLDFANTQVFSNLSENFEKTKENLNIVAKMQVAEKNGDTVTAEALRKKLIFNHAYKYNKAGALDYMLEELDDTAKLSEEEFKKKMFYDVSKPLADQTDGKSQQEIVDDIKDNVKETLQLHKDILAISPLTRPTGLMAALQSDQAKKDFILQQQVDNAYRNMLYDSALSSKVATQEANKHYNELISLNPEFAKLNKDELLYKVTVGDVSINDQGEIEVQATRKADLELEETQDKKFQEQLEKSRKANKNLPAADQIKFQLAMQSLEKALAIKGAAELSFNELRKNPEQRAMYVEAKKLQDQKRKQEIADDQAAQVIENAATSEELENALPDDTSDETLNAARKKAEELRKLEDKAQEEFKNLTDEEVETGYLHNGVILDEDALEDLDPIKAVAFKREQRERRLKKELNARQPLVDPSILAEVQQSEQADIEFNQAKENIQEDFIEELDYVLDQVVVDANGRKFVIQGRVYEISSINKADALNFDEDGNLVSVTLRDTQNNRDKVFYLKTSVDNVNDVIDYQNRTADNQYNINDIIPEAIAYNILTSTLQIDPEVLTIDDIIQSEEYNQDPVFEDVANTITEEEVATKQPNYNINNKSIDKLKAEMVDLRAQNNALLEKLDKLFQAFNNTGKSFEEFEAIPEVKEIVANLEKLQKIMDVKIDAIQYKQRGNKEADIDLDLDASPDIISEAVQTQLDAIEEVNNTLVPLVEAKKIYDDILEAAKNNQELPGYPAYTEQDLQYMKEESVRLGRQIGALKRKANYINKKIASIKEKENETNIARLQQTGETTSGSTVSIEGQVAERANTDTNTGNEETRVGESKQMTESEIEAAKEKGNEVEQIKTATDENELILTTAIGQEVLPQPAQDVIVLEGGRLNLQLTQGAFEGVTESGDIISASFVQQNDLDDNPILVETERIAAFGPENVNVGDTVEFVVDENTEWWQKNQDKYPVEEHWKRVPIFVVHNGVKVALLSSYKTDTENGIESVYGTDRKVIYENRNSRPQATVVGKLFNVSNISNATTQVAQPDGSLKTEKHFFNPTELINQGGIGIVTNKGVEIFYGPNLNTADKDLISSLDVEASKLKPGTVVIFGRNPIGEIQTFVATTKNMDEFGLTTIKNHIKNGAFENISKILGANIISDEFISDDLETYDDVKNKSLEKLLFLEEFNQEVLFSFYSPSAKSFVRVSASNLKTVLNSPNPAEKLNFSFIDIVPAQKEGVSGYDIVINKDRQNWADVEGNIVEELEQIILRKKYQVSKGLLSQSQGTYQSNLNEGVEYNSYVEYLTSSNEFSGEREQGLGHNAILSIDIKLNDRGSAWNDIGLQLDNLTTQGKKVITNEEVQKVTIEPVVPSQVPAPIQTALDESDVATSMADDLFDSWEEEQPGILSNSQVIEHNGNTYIVTIENGNGIIKNAKGNIISGQSPIGTAVLNKVNWDLLEEQPAPATPASDNTPTPIQGLNERLNAYGNAKVILPSDFYEGERPKGRLNAFKSAINTIADNLITLTDVNLNEFDFITEEEKRRLDALRPLAEELRIINMNDISLDGRRTVAVEKRYAQLTNQLANEFVDIISKHVKQQLGKTITSSNPKLSAESKPTQPEATVPAEIADQIAEVIANKDFIKLSPDGKYYINTKTGANLGRVTKYIAEEDFVDGIEKDESIEDYETRLIQLGYSGNDLSRKVLVGSSSIIGTKVDTLIRDFFAGELKPFEAYELSSKTQINNLIEQLTKVKEAMDARGEVVLANDIIVYNDELGLAGTVDLLTYDSQGNIRIYDMKSMRGDNFSTKYGKETISKYDSTTYGKSKRQSHTEQVSLYRILLYNTHGLDAKTIGIMPIELEYNSGDTTTTKLNLLKGVQLTKLDKVKDAEFGNTAAPFDVNSMDALLSSMPENTDDISNIFANAIQPTAEELAEFEQFSQGQVGELNQLIIQAQEEGENNNNECGKQNN